MELNAYTISTTPNDCVNHSSHGTIFGCLFKECKAKNGVAGGLLIQSPPSSGSVRSCVFDSCTATTNGGGIYLTGMSSVSANIFLHYCYFHANTAGTSGRDVYVDSNYFGDTATPFLSCYSTTGINVNRCMQYTTNKDGWLTTVTSSFNQYVNDGHSNAVDSYGCGIHPSFPCKTTEWARNDLVGTATID
jgi:hypothetical protein